MPITQIPFQDPAAPAEKPQPEQLDLYETSDWESAYRQADAHVVPHLLIQLQDDLARSRKREAIWISVIVHLVLFIVAWNLTFIQKFVGWHTAVVVPLDSMKDKNLTYLALPPDAQKLPRKPNAAMSDKDRVAMSRHPELDPKELRKILATPPPGRPGPSGGQQTPQPPQQSIAQNQPAEQQPQAQPSSRPQFESNQTAQLQAPARTNDAFRKYASAMTPGQAIRQATQAAADSHAGAGGQGGDFGLNTPGHGRVAGGLEVLSDTLGVDFAPYFERIRTEIMQHWTEVLPPSFYPPISKKGKLLIQFSIMPDGSVRGMVLEATSGDEGLDRAAWGGITGSNPFPPLPDAYLRLGGRDLTLRCLFTYNLDQKDLQ